MPPMIGEENYEAPDAPFRTFTSTRGGLAAAGTSSIHPAYGVSNPPFRSIPKRGGLVAASSASVHPAHGIFNPLFRPAPTRGQPAAAGPSSAHKLSGAHNASTPSSIKPTRGGLASMGQPSTHQGYNPRYNTSNLPPMGTFRPPPQSLGSSSDSSSSLSRPPTPRSGVEPAFDKSSQATGRPSASFQVQLSTYQPTHSLPQAGAAHIPYQVQRSPKYQRQRSAQSALESPRPPTSPTRGSGHGHDFGQLLPHPQTRNLISQYGNQSSSSLDYASTYQSTNPHHPSQNKPSRPPKYIDVDGQEVSDYMNHQESIITQAMRPPGVQRYTARRWHPGEPPPIGSPVAGDVRSTLKIPQGPPRGGGVGRGRGRGRGRGSTYQPSHLAVEILSSPLKRQRRPARINQDDTPSRSVPQSTIPKKRGRPFKRAESAARAKKKASGEPTPKKRARALKIIGQPEIPVPEPIYLPFICEWIECPAELHNLETLRRHVTIVHGRKNEDGVRVCRWGKCGIKVEKELIDSGKDEDEDEDADEDEESRVPVPEEKGRLELGSKSEWMEHLEKEHLIPFAWHMGDGPKATSLDLPKPNEIDPWLLDAKGMQVTPSVKDQQVEEGHAKVNNRKRWQKEQKELKIVIRPKKSTGLYMKTQAQVLQEEEEFEAEISTGDDVNENAGEDENEGIGGNGRELEVDNDEEDHEEEEDEDDDHQNDPMILDQL